MSIDLVALGKMLLLANPSAVELSVCIGVGGWGCPSSSSVVFSGNAAFALMNSPPSSASAADAITALMMLATFNTAPLFGGNGSSDDKINVHRLCFLLCSCSSMTRRCESPKPCRFSCMWWLLLLVLRRIQRTVLLLPSFALLDCFVRLPAHWAPPTLWCWRLVRKMRRCPLPACVGWYQQSAKNSPNNNETEYSKREYSATACQAKHRPQT